MAQSHTKLVLLNGQRIIVYGLPVLSKLTGRHPRTIQKLLFLKSFPKPILKIKEEKFNNFKWWCADEVEAYVHNLLEYGIRKGSSIKKSVFYTHLMNDIRQIEKRVREGSPISEKIDYARLGELFRVYSENTKKVDKNKAESVKVKTLKDYKIGELGKKLSNIKNLEEKSNTKQLINLQRDLNRHRRKIASNILVEELLSIAEIKNTISEENIKKDNK